MPSTIHIGQAHLERLIRHATRQQPSECCGLLIGKSEGAGTRVERIVEARNIAKGDHTRSYQIDWSTLLTAMAELRRQPERIVGFYHSHPDGSARPSRRDAESAWPNQSYLILAMQGDGCSSVTSWTLSHADAPFMPQSVLVT